MINAASQPPAGRASYQPVDLAAPDPAAFVAKFERHWSAPSAEGMAALLTADVVLVQPLSRTTHGLAQGQAAFANILRWVPDLRAHVDDWCARDARLFIDFRLTGTFGGTHLVLPAVDRITLRADYASERVSYFDPSPILRAVCTRPTAWFDAMRLGLLRGVLGSRVS